MNPQYLKEDADINLVAEGELFCNDDRKPLCNTILNMHAGCVKAMNIGNSQTFKESKTLVGRSILQFIQHAVINNHSV
jgi:hypothetical protein